MSKIDTTMNNLKKKQQEALASMDVVAKQFVTETSRQLKSQLVSIAKAVGKPQQSVTQELGEKGMSELLAAIKALSARCDSLCMKHVYRDTVWLHLNWPKEHRYGNDTRGAMDGPAETTPDMGLRQHYSWALADCLDELALLLN